MKEDLIERLNSGSMITCFNEKINTVSDGDKFNIIKYTGDNKNELLKVYGIHNIEIHNNFFVSESSNRQILNLYEEASPYESKYRDSQLVSSEYGIFEKIEIKIGDVLKYNTQSQNIELIPSSNVKKEISKLESIEYKTTKICFLKNELVYENNKEDWHYALSCYTSDNKNIFPIIEAINTMENLDKKGIVKTAKIFVNELERNFLPNTANEIKQITFTYSKRGAELINSILEIEYKNEYSKIELFNMNENEYAKGLKEYKESQGYPESKIEEKLAENIQDASESKEYDILEEIGDNIE